MFRNPFCFGCYSKDRSNADKSFSNRPLTANVGAVIRNHVGFQIEMVPADGINVADLGQLSVEMISVDRVSN
jgi:hypothetical protein